MDKINAEETVLASFQFKEHAWLATDPRRKLAHCTLADKLLDFLCKLLTQHWLTG
jgi:hypothetical protein